MNIFVAKLSSATTVQDLQTLFEEKGAVRSVRIIMDKETGKSKCYGFVEMDNDAEASAAIEACDGMQFMGRTIVVKESQPKPGFEHHSERRPARPHRFEEDNRNEE